MKKIYFKKAKRLTGGFTLIETLVAVALFIIVVTAGMGALLNANLLHQKSQNMRSIMDSLSFVMEDMSRNLRTGFNYHCYVLGTGLGVDNVLPTPIGAISTAKSCATGYGVSFEAAKGIVGDNSDQWLYYVYNGAIWKTTTPLDLSSYVQLTPDEVKINAISGFSVIGAEPLPGDSKQPLVIIRLVGTITYKNVVTPFSLETSVSQRLLDV